MNLKLHDLSEELVRYLNGLMGPNERAAFLRNHHLDTISGPDVDGVIGSADRILIFNRLNDERKGKTSTGRKV